MTLKLQPALESPGNLVKILILIQQAGVRTNNCISNKPPLPLGADVANPGPTLEVARMVFLLVAHLQSPRVPGGASGKEPTYQCRRRKEMWVRSLGREDPLQEGMATHSSVLAWRIPWTVTIHRVTKSQTRLE